MQSNRLAGRQTDRHINRPTHKACIFYLPGQPVSSEPSLQSLKPSQIFPFEMQPLPSLHWKAESPRHPCTFGATFGVVVVVVVVSGTITVTTHKSKIAPCNPGILTFATIITDYTSIVLKKSNVLDRSHGCQNVTHCDHVVCVLYFWQGGRVLSVCLQKYKVFRVTIYQRFKSDTKAPRKENV